ncbi:hypothetical protein BDZ89DRAFT_1077374 [Hymenopellis radicata]|nr:hypothetical protein BDZ89DRAFT_1077374 [Hymenopellis radicata]
MDASMLYSLNMLPLAHTSLGLVDNFTSSMWPEESLFLGGGDGLPPTNLSRALGLFATISARAFTDGLKIVLIGWLLELFNWVPSGLAFLYRCMIRPLYLEVSFSSRDICYDWIMLWL